MDEIESDERKESLRQSGRRNLDGTEGRILMKDDDEGRSGRPDHEMDMRRSRRLRMAMIRLLCTNLSFSLHLRK